MHIDLCFMKPNEKKTLIKKKVSRIHMCLDSVYVIKSPIVYVENYSSQIGIASTHDIQLHLIRHEMLLSCDYENNKKKTFPI